MGKSKNKNKNKNVKNAEMTPEEIFAEKYKSMTAKEMKDFQKDTRSKWQPVQNTELNTLGNAQALIENREKLKMFQEDNPLLEVDKNFSREIMNKLNTEITKGEQHFEKISSKMFDSQGFIKDYEAYGDVVNVLSNSNIDDTVKNVFVEGIGIKGEIISANNDISKKQLKGFIGKTFKGDMNNSDDVLSYMEHIRPYMPIDDNELYSQIHDIVSNEGNVLKKINTAEEKIMQRQVQKEASEIQPKEDIQAQRKKQLEAKEAKAQEKLVKKQSKKEISKLRAATGTEGGTLTDFFKGGRGNMLNIGMSAVGAIAEYKDGRNNGKTVLGSAADAALSFAVGEIVGFPGMLMLGAVKGATSLGMKGAKYAIDSSRSMNNIQRFTPFADAQFQDTQQLATMRQSGMELAKMSQYNLQQTLMGTEARHLHR